MQSRPCARSTMGAEGVGFEPTVGFPTLDFESSALNRTQPPFLAAKKRRMSNVEQPTLNATAVPSIDGGADKGVCENSRAKRPLVRQTGLSASRPKNVTILSLPSLPRLLHLVYPHG